MKKIDKEQATFSELKEFQEIDGIDRLKELLEVIKKTKKNYLFRGQENKKWPLYSPWLRDFLMSEKIKDKSEGNQFDNKIIQIRQWLPTLFRNLISNVQNQAVTNEINGIGLMAGGKGAPNVFSPLLEFHTNFLYAIWFAITKPDFLLPNTNDAKTFEIYSTNENQDKDAALFICEPTSAQLEATDINFEDAKINNIIAAPYMKFEKENQRTYFILESDYLNKPENFLKIVIKSKAKKEIMEFINEQNAFQEIMNTKISQSMAFPRLKEEHLISFITAPSIYLWKGYILHTIEYYDNAINNYTTALNKDLNNAFEALVNRGNAYLTKHSANFEKALNDYNAALEIQPDNDMVLANRANAYQTKTKPDFEKALIGYTRAIKINPKNEMALINRASVYQAQSKPDFKKAIIDLDAALKLNPYNDIAYLNRGIAYQTQKSPNFKKALDDYTKAIKINPSNDMAYLNRGVAYHTQEKPNYTLSLADLQKALAFNEGQEYYKLIEQEIKKVKKFIKESKKSKKRK